MNELSPMHLVLILIIVTLIIPVQQILRRAGYSGWLCLLALIPLVKLDCLVGICLRKVARSSEAPILGQSCRYDPCRRWSAWDLSRR